jgi:hypothetical protein
MCAGIATYLGERGCIFVNSMEGRVPICSGCQHARTQFGNLMHIIMLQNKRAKSKGVPMAHAINER